MSAPTTHLRRGLDHDWFPYRTLRAASPLTLDPGKRVAVAVIIPIQHFPLAQRPPFGVVGGLERPYPDIGTFTQREVGLQDGLHRLRDVAGDVAVPLTLVVEREALEMPDPHLLRGHCVVAGGENAAQLHTSTMDAEAEEKLIARCLADVAQACGKPVLGWRSPSCCQSSNTMALLARAGIEYVGDFANDDRPFEIAVNERKIWSVPMNHFFSDLHFIQQCKQPVEDYVAATLAAAAYLSRSEPSRGCVLSIVLHPWLAGVTHRVASMRRLFRGLRAMPELQFMTTDQIVARCANENTYA